MKRLESLLGWLTVTLFGGTGLLALLWVGVILASAFKPDVAEAPTGNAAPVTAVASTDAAPPADPAAAPEAVVAVSAAAGEAVFKKCKSCHEASEGAASKTGPGLWDVIDRPAASVEGFGYSDAMRARAGEPWTVEVLTAYLAKPKDVVPGTTMSFAGLKKAEDVANVIAYLGQQSATPRSPAELGLAAADTTAAESAAPQTDASEEIVYDEVPWPEGVVYANPPERTEDELQAIIAKVAALETLVPTLDYERARYHPIHFPPAIAEASNEECLVCHQEILESPPREASPAGVPADATLAWYQTLDTYEGPQQSFHWRHLESDYAKTVMNLDCVFCHKGNDPREESPDMVPTRAAFEAPPTPEFTLRKMVNPTETCLRCHGAMPDPENIMALPGPWHEIREDMEWAEAPNGCMSCHAESYRTERHRVSYLNALNIEEYARAGSSDSCYGCHGGRAWYRVSYPYPRHAWPLMDDMVGREVPDWALDRPTESDPDYALPAATE